MRPRLIWPSVEHMNPTLGLRAYPRIASFSQSLRIGLFPSERIVGEVAVTLHFKLKRMLNPSTLNPKYSQNLDPQPKTLNAKPPQDCQASMSIGRSHRSRDTRLSRSVL